MARHREKLTITEQVHPTSPRHGKLHFGGRGFHPKLPFLAGHKTKTIPLGPHFTGPQNRGDNAFAGEVDTIPKSRSQGSSSHKSNLTTTTDGYHGSHESHGLYHWLTKQNHHHEAEAEAEPELPRVSSMNQSSTASEQKKVKFPNMKKSASWAHFVEVSQAEAPPHLEMEVPEDWACDMSCLFLGQKFATGNHSRLYQGVYQDQDVAVKLLRLDSCEDATIASNLERQFMQEVHCLSQLHHPNIVKFMAASWKPPVCCIIMEYVPGGCLRAFLHRNEAGSLSMKTILSMARDVAMGMEYLHSQHVVHRDLKSENLVLTEDLHVKLTDFGVGCLETECDPKNADTGTYRWMAPEMICRKHCSKKVDVYSFGIILWELVTGQVPFRDMTPVQVAFAVVNKNARPSIPDTCPLPLRHLMEHCWTVNPDRRPNFYQIVQTLEDLDNPLLEEP